MPSSPAAPVLADAADVLGQELRSRLRQLSQLLSPHIPALDRRFQRRLKGRFDTAQRKALTEITVGFAARFFLPGRKPEGFFEQVAYSGRRLAKLNAAPGEVVKVLREYDALLEDLLIRVRPAAIEEFRQAREHLHFCALLTLNNAFYQVREEETRALFELFHAELDSAGLNDLLGRVLSILVRTFHASDGKLRLFGPRETPPRALIRPLYLESGSARCRGVLDPALLAAGFASYWSIPLMANGSPAGIVQLGFPKPYRWLPRELELLAATGERCLLAAEKARLLEDLRARETDVRKLSGHLLRAEEEERRRISRDLHDEAGQSLLCIRLQLEMAEQALPSGATEVRSKLGQAREMTGAVIGEIRRIISDLSPAVLEQLGLAAALKQLARRFCQYSPARVVLRAAPHLQRLDRETEIVTYRLVQECLNNAAKHSFAKTVNISLRSTDSHVMLRVRDDGIGFDMAAAPKKVNSFGLAGIRQRVELMGGTVAIASSPGKGASIAIDLPIRK